MQAQLYIGGNSRSGLSLARIGSDVVRTSEDLECWVSFDAIALAKFLLFCAVHLDQLDVLFF